MLKAFFHVIRSFSPEDKFGIKSLSVSLLQLCTGSPILGFNDRKCEGVNAT